jgi:hypothetical protein
MKID